MLGVAEPFLMQNTHPTVIIKSYRQALEDMVEVLKEKIRLVGPINKLLKTRWQDKVWTGMVKMGHDMEQAQDCISGVRNRIGKKWL